MTVKNITTTARELVEVMELYAYLGDLETCGESHGLALGDWAEIHLLGDGYGTVTLRLADMPAEQTEKLAAALGDASASELARVRARLTELGYPAECDTGDPSAGGLQDTAVQLRETFGLDDEEDAA